MVQLLKTFLKGLLYVVGLPFFLVVLAVFAAFGLLMFVFQIIKSIFYFFTGQTFFPELEEDRELRLLKAGSIKKETPKPEFEEDRSETPIFVTHIPEVETKEEEKEINNFVEPEYKPNSVEEACFNEPKIEEEQPINDEQTDEETIDIVPAFEEQIEETSNQNEVSETVLETKTEKEEPEEEKLDTYVPRSSNYLNIALDDDEENDTNSGVDIDFDL